MISKKIAIYSGSFNPVHLGHIHLANYLLEFAYVDEVWLLVSPCNPLKNRLSLLDEYKRLEMLKLAIDSYSKILASDFEFNLQLPNYTINTLEKLSECYPIYEFQLVIGSDNALTFDKWYNYKQILNRYKVLVYPRSGFDVELIRGKYQNMDILTSPYYDYSSTEIRDRLNKHLDVSSMLHPNVYHYIIENKLYR